MQHGDQLPTQCIRHTRPISAADVQADIARDPTADIPTLDLPPVVLDVDDPYPGGSHREVVDVAACAGHSPIMQEDRSVTDQALECACVATLAFSTLGRRTRLTVVDGAHSVDRRR
jgi:hypothetical protein